MLKIDIEYFWNFWNFWFPKMLRKIRNLCIYSISRTSVFSGTVLITMIRPTARLFKRGFGLYNMQGIDFTPKDLPAMIFALDYSP